MRLLSQLALLDLAGEEVPDALDGGLGELVADLPPDDLETRLDRYLGDPGAHRAKADNADAADLHGGRIYRERTATLRVSLRGRAQLARAEAEELRHVEGHAKRVGHDVATPHRCRPPELAVGLGDDQRRLGKFAIGQGRKPVERGRSSARARRITIEPRPPTADATVAGTRELIPDTCGVGPRRPSASRAHSGAPTDRRAAGRERVRFPWSNHRGTGTIRASRGFHDYDHTT